MHACMHTSKPLLPGEKSSGNRQDGPDWLVVTRHRQTSIIGAYIGTLQVSVQIMEILRVYLSFFMIEWFLIYIR